MAWLDRRLRRRRVIMCRQAVELFTDYLENAMAKADRERLEAHLADCPHCTEYLRQLRLTIEQTGRVSEELDELEPEARDELVDLYRRWRAG
jgi:anti-sigma factor RsiW